MIKLDVNETLLYNPELSIGEKMICILTENGYSKKEISKALGITIRYVQAVVKNCDANNSSFANNSSLFSEDDANNSSQVETTETRSGFKDYVLSIFENNGVNPAIFKGIEADELLSRIRAYSFDLEFDLSRLHLSSRELYDILNNN